MSRKVDVLVVGAGPTGLTAALEIARRGFVPRIIDRDEGPTPLSKAVGISARSLEILEPSGVTARLLARGLRIRRGHFWFEQQHLGAIDFSVLRHRFDFLLSLPQSDTETIMAEVLAGYGVQVEWQTSLVGLEQSDSRVTAAIEGPRGRQAVACDLLLGADGVHSVTREAVGLGFDGYTHERLWSIADAKITRWPYEPLATHAFLHSNGDVGFIIPIGRDHYRVVSNTEHALARIPGKFEVSRVLRSDMFRIPIRQAPSYQSGAVFLGGDAAHVHSPVGARGMNLGIEDAACFARRLAARALEGYTAERLLVGKRWIKLSERVLATVQATNTPATTLRNLALSVFGSLPLLQRPFLERVAGLRE